MSNDLNAVREGIRLAARDAIRTGVKVVLWTVLLLVMVGVAAMIVAA